MNRTNYPGFTLIEILVVMSIMIILGGLGLFAFGGLRDTVVINQNLNDLKQDISQIQQDAMLVQKAPSEGWVYGIGIDFTKFEEEGTYTYFKWCSGFPEFGNVKTKSEIPGYDPADLITDSTKNGYLPVGINQTDCSTGAGLAPYSGYTPGMITLGFNRHNDNAAYVVFESSTGRAFLYNIDGAPISYDVNGGLISTDPLLLSLERNQGKLEEFIGIMPISGETYNYHEVPNSSVEETENGGFIPVEPEDVEVITIPIPKGETILPVDPLPEGGILPIEIDLVRDGEVIHVIPDSEM